MALSAQKKERTSVSRRFGRAALAVALGSSLVVSVPVAALADEEDKEELVAGRIASDDELASDGTFAGAVNDVMLPGADGALIDDSNVTSASQIAGGDKAEPTRPSEEISAVNAVPSKQVEALSYAVFPFLPNPTTDGFIASIAEPAREVGQQNDLYASVMIAQAILESGSGSSGLSKPPYNNLFGIKGSYRGASVALPTSEDDGAGNKYGIVAGFRKYPSVKESLEDYADLLTRSMGSFYAPAWKSNARTYIEACNYLQGHYATDTSYSGKLQGIIIAYNLEQYDHPASWVDTAEGRAAKERNALKAIGLGSKLMPNAPAADGSLSAPSWIAAKNAASGEGTSTDRELDLRKRFAEPLGNPGVQVSLLSFGALVALFAKNEIVLLASAASKAIAHLPFFVK